jgi:DNA repair protein RadC
LLGGGAEVCMDRRARYLAGEPDHFDDAELLALVLGTGGPGRPALTVAQGALQRFGGLAALAQLPPSALLEVEGLGPARASQLHAALSAGRRSLRQIPDPGAPVDDPASAALHLRPGLVGLDVEELHALYLDRRHRLLGRRALTRGTDGHTIVEPRQVFRPAVQLGALRVVVAHNHPSGDPRPSAADRDVTRRLQDAGRILGIALVDHLIVTDADTTSMAALGLIEGGGPRGSTLTTSP